MTAERYFEMVREPRDRYFVEYHPAKPGYALARLVLTFPEVPTANEVASSMEAELQHWLKRYPVPLIVFSSDDTESAINLQPVRPSDRLTGYVIGNEIRSAWGDHNFPKDHLTPDTLRSIYHDLSFVSQADMAEQATQNAKQLRRSRRMLKAMLVFWGAVMPASVAIIGWAVGWAVPFWGLVVLAYSLLRALLAGYRLFKPSARDKELSREQQEIRHFVYHCRRNPDGFLRLKAENFEQDIREQTRKDAESLGMSIPSPNRKHPDEDTSS